MHHVGYIGSCGYGADDTDYGLIKYIASDDHTISSIGTYVFAENSNIEIWIYDTKTGDNLSGLLGSISNQICSRVGYYSFDLQDNRGFKDVSPHRAA